MPAPEAKCRTTYAIWFDKFKINYIKHWTNTDAWTENGDGFWHHLTGCGAVTAYSWRGPNPDGTYQVTFTLPIGMGGCVTRKIMAAGGPEIGC